MQKIQVEHIVCGQNNSILILFMNIIILGMGLLYITIKFNSLDKIVNISLLLVLGGGIGNLIDRAFRGYVIDYIDINNLFEFPIFNIADICVVIGVTIIIIYILSESIRKQEKV